MTEPDPGADASVAPAMDADDFVGTPPAGDAHADDFVSDDQSHPKTDADADTDTEDEG
jgi:hypothetical protein